MRLTTSVRRSLSKETSKMLQEGQRRMEAPFDRGQGPEGAVSPYVDRKKWKRI
jgi:hypothetical protein